MQHHVKFVLETRNGAIDDPVDRSHLNARQGKELHSHTVARGGPRLEVEVGVVEIVGKFQVDARDDRIVGLDIRNEGPGHRCRASS